MSSLRISHQNRATGAPTGGSSRADHAEDGGSFSVALGAAAGVAPRGAATLLDGKTGGMTGDGTDPRKRADARAKAPDVAAAALVATSGLAGAMVTAGNAGGDSSRTGSPAATSTIGGADPAVAGYGAAFEQGGKLAIGTAAGVVPGAATSANAAVASQPITGAAHAMTGALASAMSTVNAAADPGSSAASSASAAQPVPGQVSLPDPGSLVAFVPLPKGIQPLRQSASAAIAGPTASNSDPTVGASTDPAGAPLPALTAPAGPSPSNAHALTNAAVGALSAAPLASVQAAVADGGGYAATDRDRYATPDAAPSASSAAVAATTSAGGAAAFAAPSAAAASAPGGPGNDAGAIGDQVAGQLARMVSVGPREMVMRLRPPELGDLTVRVTVSGRDVSAWFASPQPQVQNAISAALSQLQTSLGNAGYNLNGAWVGGDASGGHPQQNPGPLPTAPAALAPSAALPATAISRPATSGLNVYV